MWDHCKSLLIIFNNPLQFSSLSYSEAPYVPAIITSRRQST